MLPLWPCSENISEPSGILPRLQGGVRGLQLREQGGKHGETSRRRDQWSRRSPSRARPGGLELPQECGNRFRLHAPFCATAGAACRGWSPAVRAASQPGSQSRSCPRSKQKPEFEPAKTSKTSLPLLHQYNRHSSLSVTRPLLEAEPATMTTEEDQADLQLAQFKVTSAGVTGGAADA